MGKYSASIVIFILIGLQLEAQKIKVTDGKLSDLKGVSKIDLAFTYDEDMRVGKKSESQYVKEKMEKAENDEPGGGERWKKAWLDDRTSHFEPSFTELINKHAGDAIFRPSMKGAKYKMIVNTVFIEPGFNVGVMKKNAYVDLEILFVPVDNPEKVLAKIMIYNAPGRSASYGDFDTGIRIGEGYAKAAKSLGKYLVKKAF